MRVNPCSLQTYRLKGSEPQVHRETGKPLATEQAGQTIPAHALFPISSLGSYPGRCLFVEPFHLSLAALLNNIFLTVLELFLFPFVPLLNRAEEAANAGVDFGFGRAFG